MDTLSDGDRNFFVGGWSTEGSFTAALTRIAAETKPADKDVSAEEPMIKVAKDMENGRFTQLFLQPDLVTDFTRTNVIILPGISDSGNEGTTSNVTATAEVTHGMFISGMAPSAISEATTAFADRFVATGEQRGGDEEDTESTNNAPSAKVEKPSRYEVTYRNPNAEDDDDEEASGAVDDDGNPVAALSDADVAREVDRLRSKGNGITAGEISDFLTQYKGAMGVMASSQLDPQALKDTRHHTAATPTATTAIGQTKPKRPTLYRRGLTVVNPSDLVVVRGGVTFCGIRPCVAVDVEKVTAARVATALGVSAVAAVDKSGKPKRKTDEEKQREAEATARLESESQAAAQAEEERLNTFAMPDRWPTVYISNLAFGGPVTVQQAHVRFYRCHFSGMGFGNGDGGHFSCAVKTLVTISQYCRVEFAECTFQQAGSATSNFVYAFPTSELYFQDCYFTRATMPSSLDEVLALAVLPPLQSGPFTIANTSEQTAAVHADSARLHINRSHFEGFDNAVVFRNNFNVLGRMDDEEDGSGPNGEKYGVGSEATDDGQLPIRVRPTLSSISNSVFINNTVSSLSFIDARRVGATRCYVNDEACGGYNAVQVIGSKSTPQIVKCTMFGRVSIGLGAKPFMYKNVGKIKVVDKNQQDATYMSPTY